MDNYLEDYYKARFELFSSQGWKDLIEDLEKVRDEVNQVSSCTNLDFAKGQLKELNYLLNLEHLTEQAYKGLQEDASV